MTLVDTLGEPCGGEVARDLRALQGDARQGLAWQGLAIDLLRQVEYPLVEPRLLEFEAIALFQCFADGGVAHAQAFTQRTGRQDRKSTRLNSSHVKISYAVFCLKKKKI